MTAQVVLPLQSGRKTALTLNGPAMMTSLGRMLDNAPLVVLLIGANGNVQELPEMKEMLIGVIGDQEIIDHR